MHSSLLHVVTVLYNPIRFRSRIDLFRRFEEMVRKAGAQLHVVEIAFGDRPFDHNDPSGLRLRTVDELWLKERAINIGISRLPDDWKYVAWVDADVRFARPDWAAETVHQLQHYEVVQMWSEAHDLRPDFTIYQSHMGFVHCMLNGFDEKTRSQAGKYGSGGSKGGMHWWHPGYAWAATRKAVDTFGGLLDTAILGAGDNHMAHALFGLAPDTLKRDLSPGYKKSVMDWQERALDLHKDVGCVPGALFHDFHGPKTKRGYADRWKILTNNQFDPSTDLTADSQGLWQIRPTRITLRDDIRRYLRSRDEDNNQPG